MKSSLLSPVILTIIAIISFCICLSVIQDGHNWGDDFALYISQTQAMLNGNLYELQAINRFAMEQSDWSIGPYLYPAGTSLMLCLIYPFSGLDFIALKMFTSLFFIASIPLMYLIFKDKFSKSLPVWIIILLIAFHPAFTRFTNEVLSDIYFFFFCMLSFVCIERARTTTQHILLGLAIWYSCITREGGYLLLPALMAYQFFHRRDISLQVKIIPYVIVAVLIALYKLIIPTESGNVPDQFSTMSRETLTRNFWYYRDLLADFALYNEAKKDLLNIPFYAVIVLGAAVSFRKHPHFVCFSVSVLCLYIAWPFWQGIRFLFPVLPFMMFFFFTGIVYIFKSTRLRKLAIPSVLVFGLWGTYKNVDYFYRYTLFNQDFNEAYNSGTIKMYDFIKENTPRDAYIAFFKPRALYLFTERKSFAKTSAGRALNSPSDYLLTPDETPVTEAFHPEFSSGGLTLYRIRR